ncbi:MAG TPA: hypothetical protein VFL83_11675 [Anaeromyxobacter sp.]|nr:hypothetical protein [Anaeromyxobacter sp.]
MRPNRLLLAVAPVLALAACGPEDSPSPHVNVETAPLTGQFSVTSQFEVPATVAAPGPLGDALRLVHGLSVNPGAALLDFAEDAGVPALSELRLVLPDPVEAELTGWMNAYLFTAVVDGVSPHDEIVALDDLIRSVLLEWELRSTLVLPADGDGGTHAPVSLAFSSPAGPVEVPLEPTAPVTSGVGVAATVSWPGGPEGAAIATLGDHAMGLPFGRYALRALKSILQAQYGKADVAAFLSAAVGCPALAASVASRCVGFACVGHESDLLAICEGGVAEGARQIEGQILGLDFEAIHFERGTATAVGATLSPARDATSLQDGVWTATIDVGNGPEAATATFSAVR